MPVAIVTNYINPLDRFEQSKILHSLCLTITTVAVLMRVYTRHFITRCLGCDDYLAILFWAMTVASSGVHIVDQGFGIGQHIYDIPPEWLVQGLKLLSVSQLMSMSLAPCYCVWSAIFANVMFYIVVFFEVLFFCTAMECTFNPMVPGKCGPEKPPPYATGIWSIVADFYIFPLPMPCVWVAKIVNSYGLLRQLGGII
ncbi:hypothetical protein B0J14DRAFT_649420 [Halenospora varia]|nr:hypothetical protein B0J14DRAFT_649420 [Halenospora varia]